MGFQARSGQICIVGQEVGRPVWVRLLQADERELEIELNQRRPFEPVQMDADAAYIAARRGSCRLILAPASVLRIVLAASQRDGIASTVQALWYTIAQATTAQRELDGEQTGQQRQRLAQEQAAQQDRAQREMRERALGTERARRTEALRNAARPRAVALQDQVKNGVIALFGGSQDLTPIGAQLSSIRSTALRRRSEGWELQAVEAAVSEFGASQWSGRPLPTVVIEVTVRLRNAAIGRYESLCFLTAHQEDVEFTRIRDVTSTECGATGERQTTEWLTGRSFESQWNAR